MGSRDFCYWLQGFFEIGGVPDEGLTRDQAEMIRRHLALVFRHEIDPATDGGDPVVAQEYQAIHDAQPVRPEGTGKPPWQGVPSTSGGLKPRC